MDITIREPTMTVSELDIRPLVIVVGHPDLRRGKAVDSLAGEDPAQS